MALRTWVRVLLATLGIAALAGAGELGFAYGLSIVRFGRAFDADAANEWNAQLAWVAWFAMVAAVAGAVVGVRIATRKGFVAGPGGRIGLSVVAGIGAAAIAPLCMLPAREAQLAGTANPAFVAGLAAALGAAAGIFAAIAATGHRVLLANMALMGAATWFVALVSVAPSLGPEDELPVVRLGILDLPSLSAEATQRYAVIGLPLVALLVGAATGALGRYRGHPLVAVAASGAAGPAMIALAYVVAGPGDSTDRSAQMAPYLGSLIAVGAGVLGSVLVAMLRRPAPAGGPGSSALEPTDILRPAWAGQPRPSTDPASPDWADEPTRSGRRDEPASSWDGDRRDEPISPAWRDEPSPSWASNPLDEPTSSRERDRRDEPTSSWDRDHRDEPASSWERDAPTAGRDAGRRDEPISPAWRNEPAPSWASNPLDEPVPPGRRDEPSSSRTGTPRRSGGGREPTGTIPAPRLDEPATSSWSDEPVRPKERRGRWRGKGAASRRTEPVPREPVPTKPVPTEPGREEPAPAKAARREPAQPVEPEPERAAEPERATPPAEAPPGRSRWRRGKNQPEQAPQTKRERDADYLGWVQDLGSAADGSLQGRPARDADAPRRKLRNRDGAEDDDRRYAATDPFGDR